MNAVITASDPTAVLQFNAADYITIDGSNNGTASRNLTIINQHINPLSSAVVWLNSIDGSNGASNNSIRNCILTGAGASGTFAGLVSSGSVMGTSAEAPNDNNNYVNNQVSHVQRGIVLLGAPGYDGNVLVSKNEIGATVLAGKLNRFGMLLQEQQGAVVSSNMIHGVESGDAVMASGIEVLGGINGIDISNNHVYDIKNNFVSGAGSNGIYLASTDLNASAGVYNNFIRDIASYGNAGSRNANSNGYGIVVDGGGGYNIYHNTVVLTTNQTVAGFPAALNITDQVVTSGAINFQNNLLGNEQSQPGDHYAILSTANNTVFNAIDYNDFYTVSGDLGYIGSNRTTLADIRIGFGANLHSINIRPTYISGTDLHIDPANVSNGVNLGDKGIAIAGIDIDFDLTTRNGLTPDIGADEWLRPNYGSWVGKISTDWLVPENWETNVVPDGTTDVTITGGYTHMPTIVTVQEVRDLNMSAPDAANVPILTLTNGSIQINGLINHSGGTIDGLHGTLVMNGTQPQHIPAGIFENNALNNLVVANNTVDGVIIDGAVDIYRSIEFMASGMHLNSNDFITFKSTDTVTAWLGNMTGKTFTGRATVERYIPDHTKAWQLLAVPTTGQTIKDAWQEGSASPNSNPVPGFGTQITSNTAGAITHPAPGFDLFSPNGPSMKVYNAATGLYDGVSSTTNLIDNPKGYMLFVRGDRSVTTFAAPATATILRTKGELFTPARPPALVNVNSGLPPRTFESIGNPYPSAIDLTQLTLNESGGGVQDIFYVWDPRLTTGPNSAYGLGGFQVLTRNGTEYDVTPGGGSYGVTARYIQSGQAFFVNAPFTSGTVRFTENCKVAGSNMVHRAGIAGGKQLRSMLYVIRNNEPVLIDGNLLQYDPSFENTFDIKDALKISNTGENFAINSNEKLMMVERRKPIIETDTIFFHMGAMRNQQYRIDLIASDLAQPGLSAFLEDKYLHTSVPVSLDNTTTVLFTVDSVAASGAADRFRIVFKQLTTTPVLITRLTASWNPDHTAGIDWDVEQEFSMDHYEVERSSNGRAFYSIHQQVALNNNGSGFQYQARDEQPLNDNNFYRIKAVGRNGAVQYSNIAKLVAEKTVPAIVVYPNPIAGRKIQLLFSKQRAGDYYVYLVNALGQSVFNSSIKISDSNQRVSIPVDPLLASGMYTLVIVSERANKFMQHIVLP